MKGGVKLLFIFLTFNQIAFAQTKYIKKFSLGFTGGVGIYNATPFNKSDPRKFPLLEYEKTEISKSRAISFGTFINYSFKEKYFLETNLGFLNQKIESTKTIYYYYSNWLEKYKRAENALFISTLIGYSKYKFRWLHQIAVGPSIILFDKVNETTYLTPIGFTFNGSISNESEIFRISKAIYLSLKSTHALKIGKHFLGISPKIDLLIYQPNKYILTNKTRGVFNLQLTYIPPIFKIKNGNQPFSEPVDTLKNIFNNVVLEKDTIIFERKRDNYVLFFSGQLGGPGLYYLLNTELRFMESEYLRANLTLSFSTIDYDFSIINAIVPGFNFSLMRRKWKTQFGLNMISSLNEYNESNTSFSFQMARFIEFGKGYSFKFGLAAWSHQALNGISNSIGVWPFISFGKCYKLSDL